MLAAASSCQLLSFLTVAARSRVTVLAYDDEAEARRPRPWVAGQVACSRYAPALTTESKARITAASLL